MSDSFVRELRAAAQAGVPIVCVVTHEERRAVGLVGQALRGDSIDRRKSPVGVVRGHFAVVL